MRDIYLDFNASIPVAPEVADVMRHALETGHGNPSSSHWASAPARRMVEDARRQVADLLGCTPREIVVTSGGSEANSHALKGLYFDTGNSGRISSRRVSSILPSWRRCAFSRALAHR
jgi:cysteine desulfurase